MSRAVLITAGKDDQCFEWRLAVLMEGIGRSDSGRVGGVVMALRSRENKYFTSAAIPSTSKRMTKMEINPIPQIGWQAVAYDYCHIPFIIALQCFAIRPICPVAWSSEARCSVPWVFAASLCANAVDAVAAKLTATAAPIS
jgi:hypothetical protein